MDTQMMSQVVRSCLGEGASLCVKSLSREQIIVFEDGVLLLNV